VDGCIRRIDRLELEAIIFDVDGTLAETEEIHRSAFNQAFHDAGLPWHWDQPLYGALLAVTGGKERLHHYLESQRLDVETAASRSLIAALHERKTAVYGERVLSGAVALRAGFDALIREAHHSGVRLAIATTTSLPNVHALLQAALGPEGVSYFEVIAAGDAVAHKKPAPDIYLAALSQLRLAPESCLAIEDSRNGLAAACASGITTLVVRSRYTRLDDFTGAALVLEELDELAGAGPPGPGILEALRALHRRT
jgi:beta-phosphoglucomutase-like phosphatase (HAD superfamily)